MFSLPDGRNHSQLWLVYIGLWHCFTPIIPLRFPINIPILVSNIPLIFHSITIPLIGGILLLQSIIVVYYYSINIPLLSPLYSINIHYYTPIYPARSSYHMLISNILSKFFAGSINILETSKFFKSR